MANVTPDYSPTPPPPAPAPAAPPPPPPGPAKIISPPRRFPAKTLFVFIITLLAIGGIAFLFFTFLKNRGSSNQAVTLTYWGLWEPESVIRPVLQEFETAHPNIKVNYQMQAPAEYRERLQSAVAQDKGPDIFRIHNTWLPMLRNNLSPMPSTVYSASEFDSLFYPVAKQDLRSGNTIMAVPLEYDGLAMYINEDLLKSANLSVPQNWDQLRDTAVALTKCEVQDNKTGCNNGNRILVAGAALGSTSNVDHWQDIIAVLMLQNGVDLNNPKAPTPQPATDALDYFRSFIGTSRTWDPSLPASTTLFANGKVGIYFGPSWRVFDILAINPHLKFGIYPLPQVPLDPLRNEQPITYASYWAEAVNKKSLHPAEAWQLLKFMSSPETLVKIYQNSISPSRPFGEPYSRKDMADMLKSTPYVSTFIQQAPSARSWYLTSSTYDGPSGINSKISAAFAKAVDQSGDINALALDVNQILSQYGLAAAAPK